MGAAGMGVAGRRELQVGELQVREGAVGIFRG